jgi:hypothetical protein
VFDLNVTQFMQVRLPLDVLGQIVRYAAGKEDMPGVGAIHYPLRQVNAGSGYVLPLLIPIRKESLGCSQSRRLISGAQCTGASTLAKKINAIPSPVGIRTSLPAASAARNCWVLRTTSFEQGEDLALLAAKQLGITDNVYE